MSRAVQAGALVQTSPSQIDLARLCARKWWYRYVGGLRDEPTAAQARGEEGHAQIAAYLAGGSRPTRSDVLRGMHMIPAPGPDLLVEHALERELIPGLRISSKLDLAHARGDDVGGDSLVADPGLLEIVDWKFPATARYLPTPAELVDSTQLAEYAIALGVGAIPGLDRVRLSLGLFVGSPRSARKISVVASTEKLAPTWRRTEAVARQCQEWAAATSPEDVPATTTACGAYGGCPRREICSAARHDPLIKILGDSSMSILSRLGLQQPATPPPAATAASLAAEERRAALDPQVREACDFLSTCPRGRPQLAGAAAQAWGAARGLTVSPQAGLAGTGELGAVPGQVVDPDDLVAIAIELGLVLSVPDDAAAQLAAQTHPASVSPPDAPVSAPAEHLEAAEAKTGARKARRAKLDVSPPETLSNGAIAIKFGPMPGEPAAGEADAQAARDYEAAVAQSATDRAILEEAMRRDTPPVASDLPPPRTVATVLVNCHPLSDVSDTRRMEPWARGLLAEIGRQVGVADPRLAESGPAGFGRWRHLLEEVAATAPIEPTSALWLLACAAGDETAEAVVRGLARRADTVVIR